MICLLLFAPKLIQYSKVARFLNEDDLPLIGLMRNKKYSPGVKDSLNGGILIFKLMFLDPPSINVVS